jgi:DNA-directed RNA polymerase specialized sigma24 family protein
MSADSNHLPIGILLASLSASQRQVVELCDLGNISEADAARQLGISRSTAKSHHRRAHNCLRAKLSQFRDGGLCHE